MSREVLLNTAHWPVVYANALKELEEFVPEYLAAQLVGSAYTYDTNMAEDIDMLMLVKDKGDNHDALVKAGFVDGGSLADGPDDDCWRSYKRGKVNLLLCDDPRFYEKFCTAAEVCRYLGLADKEARRCVHMIIMDGYTAGYVLACPPSGWADGAPAIGQILGSQAR